jgi:HEAT repeat protein
LSWSDAGGAGEPAEERFAVERPPAAFDMLLAILGPDRDEAVRVEAVRGLGTFRARESIPALIGLLGEGPAVSAAALAALERINEPAPRPPGGE